MGAQRHAHRGPIFIIFHRFSSIFLLSELIGEAQRGYLAAANLREAVEAAMGDAKTARALPTSFLEGI